MWLRYLVGRSVGFTRIWRAEMRINFTEKHYMILAIIIMIIAIAFFIGSFILNLPTSGRGDVVTNQNGAADSDDDNEISEEYGYLDLDDIDCENDTYVELPLATFQVLDGVDYDYDLVYFAADAWDHDRMFHPVMIIFDVPVSDFRLLELGWDDSGYFIRGTLFARDTLQAEHPLIAAVGFGCWQARVGISFIDTDGTFRAYALQYNTAGGADYGRVWPFPIYDIEGDAAEDSDGALDGDTDDGSYAATDYVTGELFRVRYTWEDVAGQLGAFTCLDNAIAACPPGYSVFNNQGEVVFTNTD